MGQELDRFLRLYDPWYPVAKRMGRFFGASGDNSTDTPVPKKAAPVATPPVTYEGDIQKIDGKFRINVNGRWHTIYGGEISHGPPEEPAKVKKPKKRAVPITEFMEGKDE